MISPHCVRSRACGNDWRDAGQADCRSRRSLVAVPDEVFHMIKIEPVSNNVVRITAPKKLKADDFH
jgi:hypothetical protein